ncbi:MAG: hypothetical protein ACYDBV_14895 [Nitrospiria bacterium]
MTCFALYTPEGHWYASVPTKSLRDDVCADYFEKEMRELTVRMITSAEYAEHKKAATYS